MAESIYTQLWNQTIITPINGKDFRHALPVGLFPSPEIFESPERLIEWSNEKGYTAKLIQKGLQKGIIEVRACLKSCKKDMVWTEEMGLENLDAMEWKTVDRPNQGESKKLDKARFADCMAMILKLSENGMDHDTIKPMVLAIYGDEIVSEIFKQIETLKG